MAPIFVSEKILNFVKTHLIFNTKTNSIMATLTAEQIEQKMQLLKQLTEEAKQLKDELAEAGALPLDDDALEQAAGGVPLLI